MAASTDVIKGSTTVSCNLNVTIQMQNVTAKLKPSLGYPKYVRVIGSKSSAVPRDQTECTIRIF